MICKNCKAEYDDNAAQCTECGMENEAVTERFEEKSEADAKAAVKEDSADEVKDDEASADEKEAEKAEEAPEKKPEPVRVIRVRPKAPEAPATKSPAPKSNLKRRPIKPTKQEKRTMTIIIVLMCIVGVCAAAISVMNITTDIFKADTSTDKVVAGVGLAAQEEAQLEELLAKSFSVTKNDFGGEAVGVEALLAKINPADKGNIYSKINDVTEKLHTEPDPAGRFADENGEYAYYKLSEKRVDKVLDAFGFKSYRGENGEGYYYCDGYYYFSSQPAETQTVKVEITKTKRVLDGSFYAEFYFFVENEGKIKKSKTRYLIVDMDKDSVSGEVSFDIKKTSEKPLISSDGKLVDSAKSYDRKTEIIEGHTKDGKLYCRYVIEYPVLTADEQGHSVVNDFLKNTVSVYEKKAEDKAVAEAYKQYKAAGGDVNQLPYVENIVVAVTFEDDKNISFVERVYATDALVATVAAQQESGAMLYTQSVESYTIDKQSGNFVSKDSVIGKDYLLVSDVLYRIYNGYDYERILPGADNDEYYYDETPEDTYGQGADIYDSAWTLTKKGVSFFYITDKGYVSEVAVPKKAVKKLLADK